ncbi:hypothetical protein TNCV_4206021 [Trichonephila clavipes]|nr:hypothetical protein TNCV_4206021 [Trichonephila clavipes]
MRAWHLNHSSSMRITSNGWRSWFVVDLLHPRLRVRPRPKSVDFYDAENRQRPCRMIKRHAKNPLKWPFGLGALGKIKFLSSISHRQSSSASLRGGNWASKLLATIGIACIVLH